MGLQTEEAVESAHKEASRDKTPSNSDRDDSSSSASEDLAPSPKRHNHQRMPSTNIATRKSTKNRQATLTTALGNPIFIKAIETSNTPETRHFEIDSPPEKFTPENYPSLKSLIQKMGFTEKTPEYKACVKFIEAISPQNKTTTHNNIIDLTSPTEDETIDNNMEILFVKTNDKGTQEKDDEQLQNDEEHGTIDENKDNNKDGAMMEI